ncbi:MAG: hypothetical protein K2Z81_24250 [Cyanobacteria bacterium]|nr:hypothetical protein [Cyanobacteriota bacterium]
MIRRAFPLFLILCQLVGLVQPGFAQGNPIGARIQQRLAESDQYFRQGDFNMAANRIDEACSMMQSSPDALPGMNPVAIATNAVDKLQKQANQAKSQGNEALFTRIMMAQQPLLRVLLQLEPQNPRWHFTKGLSFVAQAGHSGRSGTAGDRATLQMAIKEFNAVLTCPGNEAYKKESTEMIQVCQKEFSRRQAVGNEIKRRGARQFARIYNMRGGDGGGSSSSQSWCTVCGRMHSSGSCTYRRD